MDTLEDTTAELDLPSYCIIIICVRMCLCNQNFHKKCIYFQVLFLLVLVSVAAADKQPIQLYGPPEVELTSSEYSKESVEEPTEPANYNFEFAVEDGYSGANFKPQEEREEDNTQGSYSVQLPDGRRQTVTYYVDGDSGYIAEVSYEGEAQYAEPEEESDESSEPAPILRSSRTRT
ncbi:cuticle protein-like [Macrobrachium nipponense]|uniref:cuticle protein-like n=1 Tax=Macrobrachium nipponense TaxID=159736 RepID=UPI0030C7E19C